MYGRWLVVYVPIMADDSRRYEELEYSDDVVVELDDSPGVEAEKLREP